MINRLTRILFWTRHGLLTSTSRTNYIKTTANSNNLKNIFISDFVPQFISNKLIQFYDLFKTSIYVFKNVIILNIFNS